MTSTTGYVRIIDTCYSNIEHLLPMVVPCVIEDVADGDKLYHVYPDAFKALGCDVGTCKHPYPFYEDEVDVINIEE